MFEFIKRKFAKDQNPTDPNQEPCSAESSSLVENDAPSVSTALPDAQPSSPESLRSNDLNPAETLAEPKSSKGFFSRLRQSLQKTRQNFTHGLANLVLGKKTIDAELLEQIQEQLIMADVGVQASEHVIEQVTQKLNRKEIKDPQALMIALKEALLSILAPCQKTLTLEAHPKPYVILVVGVNGVGKTTTIAKLCHHFQKQGHKVMMAAGDTFRAAAISQLQSWGERNEAPVIAQQPGADSASVIYDAVQAAQARHYDLLIADTAGRLHTQSNLMDELKKVKRVVTKLDSQAPHEILLVLDAVTGQNALNQALQFHEAVGLTGVVLTKLDGTAKGGVIFAIAQALKLPIRFIGIGEGIDDLRTFQASDFIDALFTNEP